MPDYSNQSEDFGGGGDAWNPGTPSDNESIPGVGGMDDDDERWIRTANVLLLFDS